MVRPAEPKPYGVFEDGLCVEVADTPEQAEQYADQYRDADDSTDVTVEPLCFDHRDAEQSRSSCEECLAQE